MEKRFEGRVAYVLGGGASGPARDGESVAMGNGRAIALRLAAEGATVVVGDRSIEAAGHTADAIRAVGGTAHVAEVDAAEPESCRAGIATAVATCGAVDIVIGNVGIHGNQRIRQQTVEDWDLSSAVNARAHFVTAQAALEHMLPRGEGTFVFVASTAAERSSGTSVAYEASKAAQLAVMRGIAVRYAARGIRANALVLGVIDTGMVRGLFGATDAAEQQRAGMAPIGRQGRPEEVAAAAAFLASADASYVNGAALHVDGGLSAMSPSSRPRVTVDPQPVPGDAP